jgi:hypothetical protein
MYDDEELVHSAAALLLSRYTMKRSLLQACKQVQLLQSNKTAVFGDLMTLKVPSSLCP